MKHKLTIFVLLTLVITACNKEKFPRSEHLQGTWVETGDNPYKRKLRFEDGTLYVTQQGGSSDTLLYSLDKKEKTMRLWLKNHPGWGETYHELSINRKKDGLSISNFAFTTGGTTITGFKKE